MAEATLKLKANDYDRASYFVDRILPICPDAPSVLGMRAELLIGRKKFDDAASITWALLAKDRNNPDLLFLRGKALLYGGQTDQAMKHFQESLRVDPDHARAREGLKGLKNMEKAKTAVRPLPPSCTGPMSHDACARLTAVLELGVIPLLGWVGAKLRLNNLALFRVGQVRVDGALFAASEEGSRFPHSCRKTWRAHDF